MKATIPAAWRAFWRDGRARAEFAATVVFLAVTLVFLTRFLEHVEQRPGAVLPDPILALFAPRDVTWLTFGCIYAGLLVALSLLLVRPRSLLLALQVYIVMVLFRICAMFLLPLSPPEGMIPLRDPFVEYFGTGKLLTKDLFFSGHTATLFLLALVLPWKWMQRMYVVLAGAVATCVIIQHVHYCVDVFVAPFVAYASYRLVRYIHGVRNGGKEPEGSAEGDGRG